jgi:hypothetical protein
VTDATVGAVQYSLARGELKKEVDKLAAEDRKGFQKYINALLFSEGIISTAEKERIRYVLAIEPGCKMKWVEHKVVDPTLVPVVKLIKLEDGLANIKDDYAALPTLGVFARRDSLQGALHPSLGSSEQATFSPTK